MASADPSSVTSFDVAIIGAGPAGLMAAIVASERGRQCVLIEKNRKVGVKILISGGTRCNLTHDTDAAGIIQAFGKNGKFLHSALNQLSPTDVLNFFHAEGVPTKREPNGKIFPASDKALHVQQALLRRLERTSCLLANQQSVQGIAVLDGGFQIETDRQSFQVQTVVVATGGLSYAGCGTTGDGYPWLEKMGHQITPRFPALVPVCIQQDWVRQLSGISLVDCQLTVLPESELVKATDLPSLQAVVRKKQVTQRRAPLLFTHTGLSGPSAMDISREVSKSEVPSDLRILVDMLPDVTTNELWQSLQQAIQEEGARSVLKWLMSRWLSSQEIAERLIVSALEAEAVSPRQKLAELSKAGMVGTLRAIKFLSMTPTATLGYPKAEVTTGGVELKEVNPKTMESRKTPGLYIAGEILNLDGWIGGYNFQSAFSTGYVAGRNA